MYRSDSKPEDFTEQQRSDRQNRALHLYFKFIAQELNLHGLDMKKMLFHHDVEIPWNPTTVKEYLWRPIQRVQLLKESTKELTTADVDKVLETVIRLLARQGLQVEFPSIETLMYKKREEWFPKDS